MTLVIELEQRFQSVAQVERRAHGSWRSLSNVSCARVFLRGDTLLRPERLELQTERFELVHSSDDVPSAEARKREWVLKKNRSQRPRSSVMQQNTSLSFLIRMSRFGRGGSG
jgi:hypothetical protein